MTKASMVRILVLCFVFVLCSTSLDAQQRLPSLLPLQQTIQYAFDNYPSILASWTFASRKPKSKGSHEKSSAPALPQTLEAEVPSDAGPDIGGISDPGNSSPGTLLRVARSGLSKHHCKRRHSAMPHDASGCDAHR